MTSSIFKSMGLGNIDPAYLFIGMLVLILILLILLIVQMVKISKLTKKYDKFMLGKEAGSLEEEIVKATGHKLSSPQKVIRFESIRFTKYFHPVGTS